MVNAHTTVFRCVTALQRCSWDTSRAGFPLPCTKKNTFLKNGTADWILENIETLQRTATTSPSTNADTSNVKSAPGYKTMSRYCSLSSKSKVFTFFGNFSCCFTRNFYDSRAVPSLGQQKNFFPFEIFHLMRLDISFSLQIIMPQPPPKNHR